jgi:hypothetical protein
MDRLDALGLDELFVLIGLPDVDEVARHGWIDADIHGDRFFRDRDHALILAVRGLEGRRQAAGLLGVVKVPPVVRIRVEAALCVVHESPAGLGDPWCFGADSDPNQPFGSMASGFSLNG